MKIEGLQKLTLLDFPGRVAATVFTPGCDMRCPFCHNAGLVLEGDNAIGPENVLEFLKSRSGKLTGLAVTGGEPLMQADIADFLKQVKDLGFAVKLDTNGSFPSRLAELVEAKLVDYVAMDIKNCREKYALTAGLPESANDTILPMVYESAAYLMENHVPFEFRTTVVKQLHEAEDFRRIGEWLKGDENFYLQQFIDSGDIMQAGYSAHEKPDMAFFADIMREYIPNTSLRGI